MTPIGQILDDLTIFHERGGLMGVPLCINGNKNMKRTKPIANSFDPFGFRSRLKEKRSRLTVVRALFYPESANQEAKRQSGTIPVDPGHLNIEEKKEWSDL
ncbi:uncharacterized protein LOC114541931 [Dendronephthya gigantea]|uniref:uncharacterized protein LOC114541931 n=1 Tax=Dendronephthya gigantea TaxID=151771 RepID=UPI00106D4E5D|nr:uncharacterized protein LOC114541931 [Dendronephthya gigantea]